MTFIYTVIGCLVFWIAAALLAVLALVTARKLWLDRASIRWPWQSRGAPDGDLVEKNPPVKNPMTDWPWVTPTTHEHPAADALRWAGFGPEDNAAAPPSTTKRAAP